MTEPNSPQEAHEVKKKITLPLYTFLLNIILSLILNCSTQLTHPISPQEAKQHMCLKKKITLPLYTLFHLLI